MMFTIKKSPAIKLTAGDLNYIHYDYSLIQFIISFILQSIIVIKITLHNNFISSKVTNNVDISIYIRIPPINFFSGGILMLITYIFNTILIIHNTYCVTFMYKNINTVFKIYNV